jgi:hypothetical protein
MTLCLATIRYVKAHKKSLLRKEFFDFLFFKIFEPRVSHTIPVDIRLDNFDMTYEFDTNIESLGLGYNPFMTRQPVYHTFMTH